MNIVEECPLLNQNSLDVLLCLNSWSEAGGDSKIGAYEYEDNDNNCVTYKWVFSDEDPHSQRLSETEDSSVEEMKTARMAQQLRIQQFLGKVPPLQFVAHKTSTLTEQPCSSPKKKRIRKRRRK